MRQRKTPEEIAVERQRARLLSVVTSARNRKRTVELDGLRAGVGLSAAQMALEQFTNVAYEFEMVPVKDAEHPDGMYFARKRRARREVNAFHVLFRAGYLKKPDKVAADRLVALYASARGLDGAPEGSGAVRVQVDAPDPHVKALQRALDAKRLEDILNRVMSARYRRLLRAMVADIVESDGARRSLVKVHRLAETDIRGGPRWRRVVELAAGATSTKGQRNALRRACAFLVEAIERHDIEFERQQKARRVRLGDGNWKSSPPTNPFRT